MKPKKPKTFRMFAIHRGGELRFRRPGEMMSNPKAYMIRIFDREVDTVAERRTGEEVMPVLVVPQPSSIVKSRRKV